MNNHITHNSKSGFKLCIVDQEIVRIISLNRFANFKDLERMLINLPPGYNLFRRVRHLKNIGLIEPLIGDGGAKLGFRLSKKGIKFAKEKLLAKEVVLQSRPAFRTQFDHDQIVNEAKEILTKSSIVEDFISEVELRSRIGKDWRNTQSEIHREWKVPDALFSLRTSRGKMKTALEVELSQKAKTRYMKITQALLTSKMFQLVFILCKDEKLMSLIRSEISIARAANPFVRASTRSNGIYFCTLESFRRLKLDAPWEGEDNRFTINELAQRVKLKANEVANSTVSAQ